MHLFIRALSIYFELFTVTVYYVFWFKRLCGHITVYKILLKSKYTNFRQAPSLSGVKYFLLYVQKYLWLFKFVYRVPHK